MKKEIKRYLRKIFTKVKDYYRYHVEWINKPKAKLVIEFDTKDWGGCQLFVGDINNDGEKEFLWLQSLGIFKSRLFDNINPIMDKNILKHGSNTFCLTATDKNGNVLWQIGHPYEGKKPYISHATEQMVEIADVDGNGEIEVLVLNSCDELLMLQASTGRIKNRVKLPLDNFATIVTGIVNPTTSERIILVGVSDKSYTPYSYANPWLILDSSLNILSTNEYKGAGHNVAVLDADRDDQDEFIIGYQLVDTSGDVIWTLDEWLNKEINPQQQHADFIDKIFDDDEWFAAIAGSDKQYWVNSKGKTIWSKQLVHPQFCVIGEDNMSKRIFVFNQRHNMQCFDQMGFLLWEGLLPENWPKGRPPGAYISRPIHCNIPAIKIDIKLENNLLIYKEGGWPYITDFYGNIKIIIPFSGKYKQPKYITSWKRLNDIGLSYEVEISDLDNDGCGEIIVYNREHVWIYQLPT